MATSIAPGPGFGDCLRNLWRFGSDPIGFMAELQQRYGDIVRLYLGPKLFHFVFHPDHARHILQTKQKDYRHNQLIYRKIQPLTGKKGLVQLEGETWKKHRRITNASFRRKQLESFVPLIAAVATEQMEALQKCSEGGQTLDISEWMADLILKTAAKTLFGVDLEGASQQMAEAFLEANRCCGERIKAVVSFPEWLPSPGNRRFHRAVRVLDEFVYAMVAERRREQQGQSHDMLSTLAEVRDEESGEMLDALQIRDHIMTFLFAGHETTACSLAWCLYLIGEHPDVEAKLCEEIAGVLHGRTPRYEDVEKLQYTTMVYKEALRLYPPAWILAREPLVEEEIAGYRIPAYSHVLLSVWEIQRHQQFWPEPNEFRPDRFAQEGSQHPFAFFPFGGGSRICSGVHLSMLESVVILAMILQKYRLRPVTGQNIVVETTITARPQYGIAMHVERKMG